MDFGNICLLSSYNCRNRNKRKMYTQTFKASKINPVLKYVLVYKNVYNGTCEEYYDQDFNSYSASDEDSQSSSDNRNSENRSDDNQKTTAEDIAD